MREIAEPLQALGYQIIAASADSPATLKAGMGDTVLPYRLASDHTLAAARAFGIAFQVDAATVKQYRQYGIDLEAASGQTHHQLPVPSVFLIDTRGIITFAYVNPNYRVRLRPYVLLAAARAGVAGK